jgi:acetate kinase
VNILVLNSGSSSLKFLLAEYGPAGDRTSRRSGTSVLRGLVERIGGAATLAVTAGGDSEPLREREIPDHQAAVAWVFERLGQVAVDAIGHRVVHGGAWFREPVRIDDAVREKIELVTDLAPLHNRACVLTINAARQAVGQAVPMVAVFDTAFHRTIPEEAAAYAIPEEWAMKYGIRRYGFHGIAHASAAAIYAATSGGPLRGARLITLHLGNGCSATAIKDGSSLDTSMGFTPLEGLVMGTRAGDCDTGIVGYLARHAALPVDAIDRLLNEQSGLLGLSGRWSDMREVLAAAERGDPRAALAVAVFCYRARKYIGSYLAVLGGADAVVFSGGIGERAPEVRARICAGMDWCGLRLDEAKNRQTTGLPAGSGACISATGSALPVYVAAVDEEEWIAGETVRCLFGETATSE